MLNRLDLRGAGLDLDGRLPRPPQAADGPLAAVQEILAAVRERGDEAVKELTERFDGVRLDSLRVDPATIQGALEWLGIPYTGSGVTASGVAMDKTMTKRLWTNEGLSTPQYLALSRAELTRERIRTIPDELGLPVVVKPPHEGSSIGITKAAGYSEMQGAVELALGFDDELLFEQCIEGPELTCAVLGEGASAVALPLIEERGCTLIGVSISGLADARTEQLELPLDWPGPEGAVRRASILDGALDQVRDKYGAGAITRAVLLGSEPGLEVPLLPDPNPSRT